MKSVWKIFRMSVKWSNLMIWMDTWYMSWQLYIAAIYFWWCSFWRKGVKGLIFSYIKYAPWCSLKSKLLKTKTDLKFKSLKNIPFFISQQVLEVVPIQVRKMPEPSPQQWVNMVHAKMREVQTLSPIQSKVKFLGKRKKSDYVLHTAKFKGLH